MYRYDELDQAFVDARVAEFRDQTRRYLAGELSEEQFRPLRLRNGLYIQRHAPMLRIAIPYGLLSSRQLRKLGEIARRYDKGYGHFTTRQNLQLNWPALADVPQILAELATVQMHAIQTSGNCVRNVTADHLAGIAPDEIEDPRPYCELIRQWATLHPEFTYLPRKFKIAVTGASTDRAASEVHDIGLHLTRDAQHRRVPLDVEAVAQAQRPELLFRQLAREMPARLVAELRDTLLDEGLVELIVAVHAAPTIFARCAAPKYRVVGCASFWGYERVQH